MSEPASKETVDTTQPASDPLSDKAKGNSQTVTSNLMELINLCAIGLAVSFFLPWVRLVLGAGPSGFDLQKMGDMHLLLWLIPILSALTIFAGITKRSQQVVAQIAGALPFCVGVYWYFKLGSSLFQIMTYGAYLSLFFGAALFVLARNEKRT